MRSMFRFILLEIRLIGTIALSVHIPYYPRLFKIFNFEPTCLNPAAAICFARGE